MSEPHLHIHVPAGSRASFDGQKLLIEPAVAPKFEAETLTPEQLEQIAKYLETQRSEAKG